MMFYGGSLVGGRCVARVGEPAQVHLSSVDANGRQPLPQPSRRSIPRNTLVARGVVSAHRAVASVLHKRSWTQVARSIVGSNAIFVVKNEIRPRSVHQQPHDSVSEHKTLLAVNRELDLNAPVCPRRSGQRSGISRVPQRLILGGRKVTWWALFPPQCAVRIERQTLTNVARWDVVSHSTHCIGISAWPTIATKVK